MSKFPLILGITFIAIFCFAIFINYCRRKLRKTPHGLTGMCHKDGGPMCTSCRDKSDKELH